MTLTNEDVKRVKGLGCLQDKRYPDVFNVRVLTVNGKLSAEKINAIAEASKLYGSGEVAMTTRLTVEIQGVKYENIEKLFRFLASYGLEAGGTGPKVRPIVSCKGTTCQYGLIDTFSLSEKIHERFYKGFHNVILPHKFKIAVGGCPNNCVKPELNDIGIIGCKKVSVNADEPCRGCKKCSVSEACPLNAAKLENAKIKIDTQICNGCGRCATKCPFNAVASASSGYNVYIGGRWGKKVGRGKLLTYTDTEAEVLDLIEKIILFYKDNGKAGERFADTIERLGFEYIQKQLTK